MACLSILIEKMFVICAKPIFPISEPDWRDGATLTFEILADDASSLEHHLGRTEHFCLGSEAPFWGKLTSLEPCASTHPGLGLLRDKPTLRGALTILTLTEPAALTP
jgi:hypothetical protein